MGGLHIDPDLVYKNNRGFASYVDARYVNWVVMSDDDKMKALNEYNNAMRASEGSSAVKSDVDAQGVQYRDQLDVGRVEQPDFQGRFKVLNQSETLDLLKKMNDCLGELNQLVNSQPKVIIPGLDDELDNVRRSISQTHGLVKGLDANYRRAYNVMMGRGYW